MTISFIFLQKNIKNLKKVETNNYTIELLMLYTKFLYIHQRKGKEYDEKN